VANDYEDDMDDREEQDDTATHAAPYKTWPLLLRSIAELFETKNDTYMEALLLELQKIRDHIGIYLFLQDSPFWNLRYLC